LKGLPSIVMGEINGQLPASLVKLCFAVECWKRFPAREINTFAWFQRIKSPLCVDQKELFIERVACRFFPEEDHYVGALAKETATEILALAGVKRRGPVMTNITGTWITPWTSASWVNLMTL